MPLFGAWTLPEPRRWRALSLRQKLLALEEMTEIAEHFGRMRETGKMRGPTTPKQQT